jgi:mono/diheme cytochrome c family protein
MRGVIEVYDPADPDALVASTAPDPVLEGLLARGVDIDAPHPAASVPAVDPSRSRGADVVARLGSALPDSLEDAVWRRSYSPVAAWDALVDAGVSEADAWDAVAYLWLRDVDEPQLAQATLLYAKNCAACHGENGDGRGPGAQVLAEQEFGHEHAMGTPGAPATFTDPRTMLGGSSEIYYAKLRRGGMGTGMPSFGPLFTPDETWALVHHLWTFVFDSD